MPAADTATRPRQKDSLDELLANFEFARIKKYVEKRSREAAKVHVTVKPDGTVQHYSPCSPNSNRPSGVYLNLENSEDERSGVGETRIIISWYGSRDTRTAVSSARGGMGDWTNHRQRPFDRGRGFKKKGKCFVKHGTSDKDGNGCRHLFDGCYPVKTKAQDIQ